jgi:hypothetical protein
LEDYRVEVWELPFTKSTPMSEHLGI